MTDIQPTTGVYSGGELPWEWIDTGDYIDPIYNQLYDERKAELIADILDNLMPDEAPPTEDEIADLIADDLAAEFEYWEGGTDQLYGDWLQDNDGLWYPDPNGEFALIYDSNDGYGQLVYSRWVRYGRPASPCFPGQVDARLDDPDEPEGGEVNNAVPVEQIFCTAPRTRSVPYYAFPKEAYE